MGLVVQYKRPRRGGKAISRPRALKVLTSKNIQVLKSLGLRVKKQHG